MMRPLVLVVLAAIAVCCSAASAGPVFTPDALYRARHIIVSNAGGYVVAYARPNRQPMPLNERFTLQVHLFDATKDAPLEHPITDGKLIVDASMPEHMHGMNVRPTVTQNDDGSFTVDGMLLHMPGRWEVYFDMSRSGVTERAQVELFLE